MPEQKRGCGYRKIGGLYLVSSGGLQVVCDGLPLPLEPCGCCGFEPPFSRNLQRLQPEYIAQAEKKLHERGAGWEQPQCSCEGDCPLCHTFTGDVFGLMFVGSKYYTPSQFIKEAVQLGVSKRIPEIPAWLQLGKTWVLLAHQKTPQVTLEEMKGNELLTKEPKTTPAIFYAFKPERIEMPVWKGDLADAELLKLEEQGITPVLLERTPENIKLHKTAKDWGTHLDRLLEEKKDGKQKKAPKA